MAYLRDIEKLLGHPIERVLLQGFELPLESQGSATERGRAAPRKPVRAAKNPANDHRQRTSAVAPGGTKGRVAGPHGHGNHVAKGEHGHADSTAPRRRRKRGRRGNGASRTGS